MTKANRKIRVNVTKTDIKMGTPNKMDSCPVALACKRAGMRGVSIYDSIVFCRGNRAYVAENYAVESFVVAFDKGNNVKPFSFTIDLDKCEQI